MTKAELVKDAIRRFKHRPKRAIARYILHNYGDMFDNDIELIRTQIRYYTGTKGNRDRALAKEIIEHCVKMPTTKRRVNRPYRLDPGLWLVMADIHIPFHEPKAIEASIAYGQKQNVTGLLLDGDVQDCASVGFWPSRIKRDFDSEVEKTIDFLDFLGHEFPAPIMKKYKRGNHEYRLDRYYQVHAPDLIGIPLQAMDDVFDLDSRGYDVIDDNQMILAGKLPIFHGHEFGRLNVTVNPARGLYMKAKMWAMCAHCHRVSEHPARNAMGTYLTTWSIGCLCDLSPDYNPFGNDWTWGFALVNVENNGDFQVENRRILPNGTVV